MAIILIYIGGVSAGLLLGKLLYSNKRRYTKQEMYFAIRRGYLEGYDRKAYGSNIPEEIIALIERDLK